MGWVYLVLSGLLEVGWAIGLKLSEGFSKWTTSGLTLLAIFASFYFFSLSLRTISLGTGYAVWSGIGILGTALMGMFFFKEPKDGIRIICLLAILVGILGLHLSSKKQ